MSDVIRIVFGSNYFLNTLYISFPICKVFCYHFSWVGTFQLNQIQKNSQNKEAVQSDWKCISRIADVLQSPGGSKTVERECQEERRIRQEKENHIGGLDSNRSQEEYGEKDIFDNSNEEIDYVESEKKQVT